MESYIYNIACSCVSLYVTCMYLYAFQCVCTCMAVYVCVSPCTTILSLCLSLSLSLASLLLSHSFHSRPFALFLFTLFFSRPFVARTHAHVLSFRPPFSPSLSYFLTFLLFRYYRYTRFAYFYGIELDSEQGNHARSNEIRNRFSFDPAS